MATLRLLMTLIVFLLVAFSGPVLAAQVMTGSPVLPATAAGTNEWGSSFIWAYLSSWALRWWRERSRQGFTADAALWLQRSIAALVAFAGGLGVSFVFDGEAGVLTITGLTVAGIGSALLHAVRQFVLQEFVYRSALKR